MVLILEDALRFAMLFLLSACAVVAGCRSDADLMAEFCLKYDSAVVASSDCRDMASRLGALFAEETSGIRRGDVCEKTTACLPCRSAARKMLMECGYAEEMKPVLEQMHFSRTLRKLSDNE